MEYTIHAKRLSAIVAFCQVEQIRFNHRTARAFSRQIAGIIKNNVFARRTKRFHTIPAHFDIDSWHSVSTVFTCNGGALHESVGYATFMSALRYTMVPHIIYHVK